MSILPLKLLLAILVVSLSATATAHKVVKPSNPSIHVVTQPYNFKGPANKDTKLIKESCKKAINYEFCVKTLESDPRCHNADVAGLTKIILEHMLSNSNKLYRQANFWRKRMVLNDRLIRSLEICTELFGRASDEIAKAVEAMGSNDYQHANLYAAGVKHATETCIQDFKENGRKLPFAKRIGYLSQLSSIVLALTAKP